MRSLARAFVFIGLVAICALVGGCSGVLSWKTDEQTAKELGDLAGTFLGLQPGTAVAGGLFTVVTGVLAYFNKRNADRAAEAELKRREAAAADAAAAREREAQSRLDANWYEAQMLARAGGPGAVEPGRYGGAVVGGVGPGNSGVTTETTA